MPFKELRLLSPLLLTPLHCTHRWFYPLVDRCYVATEPSRQQALRLGLATDQIRMYGLPIRPSFSRKYPPKCTLRRWVGLLHRTCSSAVPPDR